MARSTAKVDASQVESFARKLQLAAQLIEEEGEQFEEKWGGEWVDQMRAIVPVASGKLRDSIEQVEPGGITMGDAFYWRFLEFGTSKMAPQPFVRPSMKRIRTPARKDAGERAVKLIQRGR
jgi:HK97 gp10 family phage protein